MSTALATAIPSVPSGALVQRPLAPFGPVWVPRAGAGQLQNIGSEVAEYFSHESIRLAEGDVVVDVGANIGAFALEAARHSRALHIVCIEPIPILFAALAKNLASVDARTTMYRIGLTHEGGTGPAEFTYFQRLPCDSTGCIAEKRRQFEKFFAAKGAALRASASRFWWPGRIIGIVLEWIVSSLPKGRVGRWFSDLSLGATRVKCDLVTFDRVLEEAAIDQVGLLKVDVEGAELDVLMGISDAAWKRVRQVVLEGHDENGRKDRITELLSSRGFDVEFDKPALADERGLDNFLLFATRRS